MNKTRRSFLSTLPLALGAVAVGPSALLAQSPAAIPRRDRTVQEVIDLILAEIPGDRIKNTLDTLKSGEATAQVTGIATTFLATSAVIQEAVSRGANFIITHEPTYYNHLDEINWLQDDPVYAAKRRLLESGNVVVWRFHDYWHRHRPDGILTGFLRDVDWTSYVHADRDVCTIPATTLGSVATYLKEKLGIDTVRVVGNLDMPCTQIGLRLGASGGRSQMALLSQKDVEVLVCGEVNEWETTEYVRDALWAGHKKGLIVLGHAFSEEPGMDWLAEWLQSRLPELLVHHIPAGDPFHFI